MPVKNELGCSLHFLSQYLWRWYLKGCILTSIWYLWCKKKFKTLKGFIQIYRETRSLTQLQTWRDVRLLVPRNLHGLSQSPPALPSAARRAVRAEMSRWSPRENISLRAPDTILTLMHVMDEWITGKGLQSHVSIYTHTGNSFISWPPIWQVSVEKMDPNIEHTYRSIQCGAELPSQDALTPGCKCSEMLLPMALSVGRAPV